MAKNNNEVKVDKNYLETSARTVVDINKEGYATIDMVAFEGDVKHEGTLSNIPTTWDTLLKRFSKQKILEWALKAYFTKETNSLRQSGALSPEKALKKADKDLDALSLEQIEELLQKKREERK